MRPNYVHVGILVLFGAFSSAFVGSFIVLGRFSDSYNTVTRLTGGSSVYVDFESQVAWYGITPIVIGIVLSVIAYALERRFPTDSSFSVPFFAFALPCLFWSVIYLVGTYNGYSSSIRMSDAQYNGTVNGSLLSLYRLIGLGGALWLFAGILLILLAKKGEAV